ncbi:MAG TPA: hypothetical protein VGF99_22035 [Myxococcota bacterium]
MSRLSFSAVVVGVVGVVGVSGCGFGSEAAFYGTRSLDTCDLELPVCNTTAGCKLTEEERYIEGVFPGQRSLIVPTAGEATIRVSIYWRTQLGPGADTEIIWHEPACVDAVRYESQGADVFADSNAQGIFVQERKVFRAGEHLIEVRSDATADYLLRTEVLLDSEVTLEQGG